MFNLVELKKHRSFFLTVGLFSIFVASLIPLTAIANIITSADGEAYKALISAYYVSLWPLILIAMGAIFYRRSILQAHTSAFLLVLVLVLITTVFWGRGYYGSGYGWHIESGYSAREFYSDVFFVFSYVVISTLIAFAASWIMSAFRMFRKIQFRLEAIPRWKKIIGMSLVYLLPFSLLGYYFSSVHSSYYGQGNPFLPLLIGLSGLPILFFVSRYFMQISKDFSGKENVKLMSFKQSLTYLAILVVLLIGIFLFSFNCSSYGYCY